jgi:hypothetical protein
MKNKALIAGILTGIIAPMIFSYALVVTRYPELLEFRFFRGLWGGSQLGGPIIRLSVLINLPFFFISLQFDKENFARGVLLGTLLIGFYIILLHLIK